MLLLRGDRLYTLHPSIRNFSNLIHPESLRSPFLIYKDIVFHSPVPYFGFGGRQWWNFFLFRNISVKVCLYRHQTLLPLNESFWWSSHCSFIWRLCTMSSFQLTSDDLTSFLNSSCSTPFHWSIWLNWFKGVLPWFFCRSVSIPSNSFLCVQFCSLPMIFDCSHPISFSQDVACFAKPPSRSFILLVALSMFPFSTSSLVKRTLSWCQLPVRFANVCEFFIRARVC